ncbi:MAG: hypothetical protein ACREMA_14770 [Longimicrobiales bacterium]
MNTQNLLSMRCGALAAAILLLVSGVAAQQPAERPDHAVVLILRENGFEQANIRIPAGKAHLVLRNYTFSEDLRLNLEREAGAQLRSVALNKRERSWRETIELTPGVYILSVPGQQRWRCRLTVTPRT